MAKLKAQSAVVSSALVRCENCRFFDRGKHNECECKRYPPIMKNPRYTACGDVTPMMPIECCFPAVNPGEWCGEWQPASDRHLDLWRKDI